MMVRSVAERGSTVAAWRWWLIAGVSYVSLVILEYYSPIVDDLYNADSMYLFLLVDDVAFNGGRLADWHLSAHYLLFPDAIESLFALALAKVGIPIHVAGLLVFSLPPVLLLAVALHFLMRTSVAAAVATSAFAWASLLALANVLIALTPQALHPWGS